MFHPAFFLCALQAGSSMKPQIPLHANVHAVFESYSLKFCTRVDSAPAEASIFFFFFLRHVLGRLRSFGMFGSQETPHYRREEKYTS